MRSIHHHRDVLARETAHIRGAERHQLARMVKDAIDFAHACKGATVEAITLKLLTLHEGSERWVRILVAKAALEAAAPPPAPALLMAAE